MKYDWQDASAWDVCEIEKRYQDNLERRGAMPTAGESKKKAASKKTRRSQAVSRTIGRQQGMKNRRLKGG